MAEEKKETTKKSAPKKKEGIEEVKVEKRFCTKCGKELKEGEECSCSCQEELNNQTINGDAIATTCKNVWSTIISVFKKPATTITEEANSKDTNKTIILTVLLAIAFAIYLMAMISTTVNNTLEIATNSLFSYSSASVNINYFQVFIYGILIYALMAIIPIISALIIAKIARNGDFTFKKSFKIYITSNAPLIIAYLAMALIYLIDVTLLNVLGLIAFCIISLSCFFNFILAFNKETRIKEDRRSYALTGLMTLWVIITVIAFIVIGGSILGDAIGDAAKNSSNYSDFFNFD